MDGVLKFGRKAFLSGLLTLLPLGITVFVIAFLMEHVGRPVSKVMFKGLQLSAPESFVADCAAIFFSIVAVTAVGAISRYVVGRWFIGATERVIGRVPFISMVYGTSRQIVGTFADGNRAVFQKAVMLRLAESQISVIGFLSADVCGELSSDGRETVAVFVPTTPNPTSGFLLIVPKDSCIALDMSIGDAMKMIISGGALVPKDCERNGAEEK
ncbi:MAG: DUF502 domain-containing protein [Puniceicoccales bacterium]|jgi:uncharacterized membrane protein|nr:DUF502 domain-containing protein [Puniceicoccales bacterium]